MEEIGGSSIHESTQTFAEIMLAEARVKAIALGHQAIRKTNLRIVDRRLDAASHRAGK